MKLVYQAADIARAQRIVGILEAAGIETDLQGTHTHGLGHLRFTNPLTVWVLDDSEESHAREILEKFFAKEAPPKPIDSGTRVGLFLAALAVGAVLVLVYLQSTWIPQRG